MKRVLSIVLTVLFLCVGAWCTTVTSVTKIVGPDGQPFNGTITLQLPFAGVNSSTNQLILATPVVASVINGTITQPFAVTGNDLMSPAMPYSALYTDVSGNPVTRQLYYITGATFDVGSAPATPNFLNSTVTFANNITATGNVSVGGTLGGATAINNVQQASSTVSIATAYAALPSTGGMVALTSDITLSTATALTTTLGKPLFLSLGGHTITCTNASGVCLKILKPDGTPRDPMVIMNGVLTYGGASTGVTGIQIGDATHAATNIYINNFSVNNFNTASSVGMDLNFVEDGHFDSISFNGNTLALQLDINTNQNQFSNVWFQANVTALQATDANEYTFEDCLFQSNTATKPVQIIATTVNVVNVKFLRCHFENNGDTTSSTRQISFNAATGKKILRVEVVGDLFNGGVNNPSTSYAMEFIGAGTVGPLHIEHNQYSNSAHTFDPASTSLIAAGGLTVINDNFQATDAGLNLSNITGCDNLGEGLVFGPFGALKIFQIRGGGPSDFQSTLLFKDCTVPEYILSYSSSTWNFQNKLIKTSSQFQTTATTGTAPFIVASTTPVANLVAGGNTVTVGTGNVTTAGTAVTNGTTQDQTGITVTGAATTDACTANIGAALPATWQTGIRFWCDVTATNTVTVHLQNPTAGSITPAATQVNVRVTR